MTRRSQGHRVPRQWQMLKLSACALVLCLGLNSLSARAQDPAARTLARLGTLAVIVEELPPGARLVNLSTNAIQTDAELKLRLAGIHVVSGLEARSLPGDPYIWIQVTITDDGSAANVNVMLRQGTKLERNGESAFGAGTWDSTILIARPSQQGIRDTVKDILDQFLNAWLSVNPKH